MALWFIAVTRPVKVWQDGGDPVSQAGNSTPKYT
jgi:hypothetical protein